MFTSIISLNSYNNLVKYTIITGYYYTHFADRKLSLGEVKWFA